MTVADALAWAVLVALLAAIAVVDARTRRIPNALTLALLVSGAAAAPLPAGPGLPAAAAGALVGGALPLGVALAFRWRRGVDGLGMGDVKFLAGAGAWTGWQGVGPVVFVASAVALLTVAALAIVGRAPGRRDKFAFGPYLCLALFMVRSLQSWISLT